MKNNNRTIQSVTRVMLVSVCLAVFLLSACKSEQNKQAPRKRPIPEVVTMTIQTEPVNLITELPGRVVSYRTAEIRPQVNGLIIKRLFTEGAFIKEGQPLYQIDPAPFQAALDNAKAALVRSKAQLPSIKARAERYKELLASKAVSQQDYDDAATALDKVNADIEYWKTSMKTARINLGYCRINAPISGRIGRSSVTEGAIVTAYQPVSLATIRQLDPIYVEVPQSRTAMLHLKKRLSDGTVVRKGQAKNPSELVFEDGSVYSHKGEVQFSEVIVDQTTGSVTMQVIFPNPDHTLLPGMFVRARIHEGLNPQGILVPQESVSRNHKGEPFALIVNAENKVEVRPLVLGRSVGNKWLVTSGLAAGDQLILKGRQFIRPGMPVKVKSSPAASSPAPKPSAQGDA